MGSEMCIRDRGNEGLENMMKSVRVDKLPSMVGQEIGVSQWYEVTQDAVNQFSDITLDHQFIHVDEEKAAQTPFGGTIAHGFLTLSMLSHFAETGAGLVIDGTKMGVNYGFDKVRFIHPVRVGKKIRSRTVLQSFEDKGNGQYLLHNAITIEIQNVDKPALVGVWLTMLVV